MLADPMLSPASASSGVADQDSSSLARMGGINGDSAHDDDVTSPLTSAARTDAALGWRQLRAMMRKNVILKRRAWMQTICELLAPLLLTMLILVGYRLADQSATVDPPQVYANHTFNVSDLFVNTDAVLSILNRVGITDVDLPPGPPGPPGRDPEPPYRQLITNFTSFDGPMPVPTFDAFVTAHDLIHSYLTRDNASTLVQVNRLAIADARFQTLVNLGKLSFAPDTSEVREVVAMLARKNRLFNGTFDKIYASEDDAVDWALRDFTLDPGFNQRDPYALRSWAVIVFNQLDFDRGQLDYTIRMNYSIIPTTRQTNVRFQRGFDGTYQRYILSGFLTLQTSIEAALVDVIAEHGDFAPNLGAGGGARRGAALNLSSVRGSFDSLMTVPMPVQTNFINQFYTSSGPFVGLVLCLSLLYPLSRLIKQLVEEKESRMKETLKIMGLFNWVFSASYGITYAVVFTIIAIVQTILMGGSVMSHSSKAILFVYFWFFGMSTLCLAFLISVFFSRAKLAGIVGPIISFALVIPRYAFLSSDVDDQISAKLFTCILAPSAFAFAMDDFMLYEGAQQGITFANAGDQPVSVSAMLAFMFFDSIAYALFAWYFEQVLPNEYGTHREPWFIFTTAYWRETLGRDRIQQEGEEEEGEGDRRDSSIELIGDASPTINAPYFESPDSPSTSIDSQAASSSLERVVVISRLRKVFVHGNPLAHLWERCRSRRRNGAPLNNEVVAVDDLSLDMYSGQITCLLGHNGAGKSTTISILTGLYKPDGGECWINGLSLTKDMHAIRRSIGVVPQQNVIFDMLTVREHLELLAVLKGTPASQVEQAVKATIDEVGLTAKTDVQSRALSGGMKRKLCVGMALIGDSRVVFLDEPTSGMDPYSRRSTWEMLKRAKQGRVVVLTTHFMDEADLLGDRVAIIANGRLRAAGSPLFLKNRFGVGYNLTLVYQRESLSADAASESYIGPTQPRAWSMASIGELIRAYVPDATPLSQAAGELSFRLPLGSVSAFGGLFTVLDERKAEMGIAAYGVSITTLEEVFLRVAHEDKEREKALPAAAAKTVDSDDSTMRPLRAPLADGGVSTGPDRALSSEGQEVAAAALSLSLSPDALMVAESEVEDLVKPMTNDAIFNGGSSIISPTPSASDRASRRVAPMRMQIRELIRKRMLCASRDLLGRFFEVVLPVVIVALVLLILIIDWTPAGPSIVMGPQLYQSSRPWKSASVAQVTVPTTSAHLDAIDFSADPAHAFARHRLTSQALGASQTTTVRYYPSYAIHDSANSPMPDNSAFGLLPVPPLHANHTDTGLIYTLGMTSAGTSLESLQQPYYIDYAASSTTSLELSLDLLSDILTHVGSRPAAFVFGERTRVVAPLSNSAVQVLTDALIIAAASRNTSGTISVLPLEYLDANGIPHTLNYTMLESLLTQTGNETTTLILPVLGVPVTGVLSTGGNLAVNLPGRSGRTVNVNLNRLARDGTRRINGTDEFAVNFGDGYNFTVIAGPDIVSPDSNRLNATQLLEALQFTYPNATLSPMTIPTSSVIGLLNNTIFVSAASEALLSRVGLGEQVAPVTLMHNVSLFHALPAFAADLFRARLTLMYSESAQTLAPNASLQAYAAALPAYTSTTAYTLRNHPLPLTTQSVLRIRAILAIVAALFVLIPFCYLPASFVIFVVKERSSKSKHLQLVSGVSPAAYWHSTFIFDTANYIIVCVAVICVFLAYNNESFTGDASTGAATFLLFLLYGLAVLPMAYSLSFLFQNHTSAQVGISSILFLLGFVLTIGSFILDNVALTRATNYRLKPFYRLSPPFCLGEGLINLAMRALRSAVNGSNRSVWQWNIVGRVLVYLPFECVGYYLLTIAIEYDVAKKLYKIAANKFAAATGFNHASSYTTVPVRHTRVTPEQSKVGSSEDSLSVPLYDQTAGFVRHSSCASPDEGDNYLPARATESNQFGETEFNATSRAVPSAGDSSLNRIDDEESHSQPGSLDPSSIALGGLAPGEDDDVEYERRRVESGAADNDLVVIKHLHKSFGWDGHVKLPCSGGREVQVPLISSKPLVAVRDLCLSVPAGQCFGFLGINGAGKSTTMSMMTGDLDPDGGRAFLSGFDVATQRESVRHELGYCPQQDPLLDLLTSREHLMLYGRIRGLSESRLSVLVQHLIDQLGLAPFADNISETYSGGNKRKLSLALALIGEPSVVFLDEPSTGMDPVSRRFMWGVIADLSKSLSVVLTTHSMEECEALCARVGIMVNGVLACVGSLEHLKQRYGRGLQIDISVEEEARIDGVREFMTREFTGAEEQECHAGRIKYVIPKPHESTSSSRVVTLGLLFARIEEAKAELGISDYAIGGASLEQIFVQIAQSQDQRLAEERARLNEQRESQ